MLNGRTCQNIAKEDFSWSFNFDEGYSLTVTCPWRIVIDDRIALAHSDHEQQFGLPERVDAISLANDLLTGNSVMECEANSAGDLTLRFSNLRLEVFNDSTSYESWVLSSHDHTVVGRNE